MGQVETYRARGVPSGKVPRARAPYPIWSTQEYSAMAGFGQGLAGIGADILENRKNILEQSELTSGKAEWMSQLNIFDEGLREDADYESHLKKFNEFNKTLLKNIIDNAKLPSSKRALQGFIELNTPRFQRAITDRAWALKEDDTRARLYLDVSQLEVVGKAKEAKAALAEAAGISFDEKGNIVPLEDAVPYISREEAIKRMAVVDYNVELNAIQKLINDDPEQALVAIEMAEYVTDEGEKNRLRSAARSRIASLQRQTELEKQRQQDETYRQALIDFWDDKLTNVDDVTRLLEQDLLTDTQAKYLRSAILNPKPVELDLKKYAEVYESVGKVSKNESLELLYKNLNGIDPTTGKSLVKAIIDADDPDNPINSPDAKRILTALTELKNDEFFVTQEEIDEAPERWRVLNLSRWLNHANDFEKKVKGGDLETPKQKEEWFNSIKEPINKEKAKRLLSRLWEGYMSFSLFYTGYKAYKKLTGKKSEESKEFKYIAVNPKTRERKGSNDGIVWQTVP